MLNISASSSRSQDVGDYKKKQKKTKQQENQVIITATHFPEKKNDPPHVLLLHHTHIFIRSSSRCVCVCVWNDGGVPVIESACHIVDRCASLGRAKTGGWIKNVEQSARQKSTPTLFFFPRICTMHKELHSLHVTIERENISKADDDVNVWYFNGRGGRSAPVASVGVGGRWCWNVFIKDTIGTLPRGVLKSGKEKKKKRKWFLSSILW